MNQFILRAVFPSCLLEFNDAWNERAAIKGRVFAYDRVVLSDRVAAMHGVDYKSTKRIAAEVVKLKASPHWWNTIRIGVLEYCKVRRSDIVSKSSHVVTYVSRQKWGRRMLREEDHTRLVAGLEALRDRRGVEVHIVELDRLSRAEQIRLAARTTVRPYFFFPQIRAKCLPDYDGDTRKRVDSIVMDEANNTICCHRVLFSWRVCA
jgi:hypothetical protein